MSIIWLAYILKGKKARRAVAYVHDISMAEGEIIGGSKCVAEHQLSYNLKYLYQLVYA